MERRQFNAALLGLAAASGLASQAFAAQQGGRRTMIYAGKGARLYGFSLDAGARALAPRFGPYAAPDEIQGCVQNPRTGHLYVATSDWQTTKAGRHLVSTFKVGADGALEPVGQPVKVRERMIQLTLDPTGTFLFVAIPRPGGVSVHRLAADGSVGEALPPDPGLEFGFYPHQLKLFPSNRAIALASRGLDAAPNVPEQPGSVRVFGLADGKLTQTQLIAPRGGLDYRSRSIDFHPSGKWAYIGLESQDEVRTHAVVGDRLSEEPIAVVSTLRPGIAKKPLQQMAALQVHPNGRSLYVVNRANGTESFQGQTVANGGEDSVAVFSIDPKSGKPALVQSADIHGLQVRGASLTPDGRWYTAASYKAGRVKVGERVENVPLGIALFAVAADGRLTFASRLALEGDDAVIWAGPVLY